MTGPVAIPASVFLAGLTCAGDQVRAAAPELCALDAAAGDGDLGVTLAAGFGHAREVLAGLSDADAGEMLTKLGADLARNAPSTIGTLLASAFLRAGKALVGVRELSAGHIATLLETAASAVADRGRASVGERTVLDAMFPAAQAAAGAAAAGEGPAAALAAAEVAAAAAAEATITMEPTHGRSAWVRERARGTKDAGAAAWALFVTGLAAGCAQASGQPGQAGGRPERMADQPRTAG